MERKNNHFYNEKYFEIILPLEKWIDTEKNYHKRKNFYYKLKKHNIIAFIFYLFSDPAYDMKLSVSVLKALRNREILFIKIL